MLVLILTLFMVIIVGSQFVEREPIYGNTPYDLSTDWVTEDGRTVSLSELPAGEITIKHDLTDLDLSERDLCLKSSDTFLKVMVDGKTVYDYAPTYPNIIGKSYGNYIHVIPLGDDSAVLTMTLTPVYDGDTADLSDIYVESSARYIVDIYRQGLPEFVACLIMVFFGIVLLLLELTSQNTGSDQPMGFMSLGIFAVIVGVWSMNDTFILQSISGRPELIKMICYICMMMIAYPPVSFVASAAKRRDTILLPVLAVLIGVNFILTFTLAELGIVDPHYMLLFSHINIMFAMFMTIFLMVKATRNNTIEKRFLLTMLVGMTAALIGVGIDLLRFWFVKNSEYGSSSFTRIGVLVFIIAEGMYLLKEKNRLIVEKGKADLMQRLAYTDVLTGLANRAAYHEKEKELTASGRDGIIVLLDINFLKRVNDEYGHAEGDKHIIAAADVIRESLKELGDCYRIGGDEFAAILDTADEEAVAEAFRKLEAAEDDYNEKVSPPVPLRIAYGYAIYSSDSLSTDTAEDLADKRMYEMKGTMKASK